MKLVPNYDTRLVLKNMAEIKNSEGKSNRYDHYKLMQIVGKYYQMSKVNYIILTNKIFLENDTRGCAIILLLSQQQQQQIIMYTNTI